MRVYLFSALAALASICALSAQSKAPVVVPAAGQTTMTKPAPAVSNTNSGQTLLKMLQEMKAANEETLRKQGTQLDQLDELQKVADEIRLHTRRS
jgi:hypothetical protein